LIAFWMPWIFSICFETKWISSRLSLKFGFIFLRTELKLKRPYWASDVCGKFIKLLMRIGIILFKLQIHQKNIILNVQNERDLVNPFWKIAQNIQLDLVAGNFKRFQVDYSIVLYFWRVSTFSLSVHSHIALESYRTRKIRRSNSNRRWLLQSGEIYVLKAPLNFELLFFFVPYVTNFVQPPMVKPFMV
jgi:hypothetical protein